jgi:hypothetical protein
MWPYLRDCFEFFKNQIIRIIMSATPEIDPIAAPAMPPEERLDDAVLWLWPVVGCAIEPAVVVGLAVEEEDVEQMSGELSVGGKQTPCPTSVVESCPVQPGKQQMPFHGNAN